MELILKQDVENLGFKDDLVSVKNGYGRNYLIPQGKAILATPSAKKVLAENLKQKAHKEKQAQTPEEMEKAAALEKEGHSIDKKYISIKGGAIKRAGPYEAEIRLHREVQVEFSFEVIGEKK